MIRYVRGVHTELQQINDWHQMLDNTDFTLCGMSLESLYGDPMLYADGWQFQHMTGTGFPFDGLPCSGCEGKLLWLKMQRVELRDYATQKAH